MSEARMWGYLREKQQRDYLEMERITERIQGGVADVNWAEPITRYSGWTELKYIGEVRPGWRIPRLGLDQVLFLQRRARIRGFASILLRIGEGKKSSWRLYYARPDPQWRSMILGPEPQEDVLWPSFPGCEKLRIALLGQAAP